MVRPRARLVVAAEAAVGGRTAASGRTVDNVVELTTEVTGTEGVVGTFRTFARVAESAATGINTDHDEMVDRRVKADGKHVRSSLRRRTDERNAAAAYTHTPGVSVEPSQLPKSHWRSDVHLLSRERGE